MCFFFMVKKRKKQTSQHLHEILNKRKLKKVLFLPKNILHFADGYLLIPCLSSMWEQSKWKLNEKQYNERLKKKLATRITLVHSVLLYSQQILKIFNVKKK